MQLQFDDLPDESGSASTLPHFDAMPDESKQSSQGLLGNIYAAGKSAAGTINDTLNPFSEANLAATAERIRNPTRALTDWTRVGSGLAAVPELAAAPVTGAIKTAAPYIASPMASGIQAVGEPIAKALNPNAVLPSHADVTQQIEPQVETALGLAAPARGKAVPSFDAPALAAKPPSPVAPTVQELKAAAKAGYEHPTVQDVKIAGSAGPRLADEIIGNFNNELGIDENVAPKTFGILQKLYKMPEAEGEADPFLTVNNLRNLRRTLGNAAATPDATERLAARSAQLHIDEFLSNLPEGDIIQGDPKAAASILKEANANYSAMAHAADLDSRMIHAQLRASAANSGQNVGNTIRQKMADILVNPKLSRGFTANELEQMRKIVEGSPAINTTRMASNILGGGGGMASAITGFMSHGLAPIAGYALRQMSNLSTMRAANALNEAVRMRSPLGRERALEAAIQQPSLGAGNAAIPLTMSPALSVPSLQVPALAGAQEDQQNIPRPPSQQKNGGAIGEKQAFARGGATDPHGRTVKPSPESEARGTKSTKAQAHYRQGKGDTKCQNCTMFRPSHECSAVQGTISPTGLCDYFEAKGQTGAKINRKYDVPYLAGSSNDSRAVYIDRHVPPKIAVKRAGGKGYVSIDPAHFLAAHEENEHKAMKAGKPYEKAHVEDGNAAERKLVKEHGLDWGHYEKVMDGLLSHIEHEHPKYPPPDLYDKPYPHREALLLERLEGRHAK